MYRVTPELAGARSERRDEPEGGVVETQSWFRPSLSAAPKSVAGMRVAAFILDLGQPTID